MRQYFPMVRRVSANFRRRIGVVTIDLDDMISWGTFGLLHTLDIWDPDRGVRFETLAAIHIRGRIMDEMRTQDWAPRNVRRRQREADRAYEDLAAGLGRSPTSTEVAELLRTTEDDLRQRGIETEAAKIRSLQEATDPMAGAYYEAEDHFVGGDELEDHILLLSATDHAMGALSVHERLVIVLCYFEGMSLEEVARVTGFPDHRVSVLHADGVLKVRSALAELLVS
jgi:RNA polymerase sigma factor for flagellar operon FliA